MDVVTIGETMALFTPESSGLMRYAHTYTRKFGGSESNVAIGLVRLGHHSGWISRVGDDELGTAMISFIRGEGVDVSEVQVERGGQTGIYFKELRREGDVRVLYYRKHSAASRMSKDDLNEAYIAQAKYLHISGITPALSDSCYEMLKEAVKVAKKHGVTIVFDPNLRKTLWTEEKAKNVLVEFVRESDIVLPGIGEGKFLYGVGDPQLLGERFLKEGPSTCVLKVGAEGAYYFTKDKTEFVPSFNVEKVVDPVGSGDGFCSGFLSGLLDGLNLYDAVRRGNGVGAMVAMVNGDVEGLPDKRDLENFIHQTQTDDVNR
ncbi:sugar kinase [Alkalihalobacterium elongatum]|uniref:sugar kinase n=1 Tax=Alkalihalobacterium elongatum TaxID=2675466 RepID=UPI001C1F3D02|nr:sugar kinase [Alkalihalobacterium elongatum]